MTTVPRTLERTLLPPSDNYANILEWISSNMDVELVPWQKELAKRIWEALERGEDISLYWRYRR